jgi:type II secretory ATPase GspE/PulE/Tfp pilus assembly ATPase PilB-like protein
MKPSEDVLKCLGIDAEEAKKSKFYQGKGCSACSGTGYSGRLPIFEFLVIDNEMREKLVGRGSEPEIRAMARQQGYGGLLESGVSKALQGLTTTEEVLRVAFTENVKS